jgi:Flp pilus assembly protein TadD
LLLLQYGRGKEALELLARALSSWPDHPDLLLLRSAALAAADRHSEAEAVLKHVQSRWPEWDNVWIARGLLLEHAGRKREALGHLRTAAAMGAAGDVMRCAVARLEGAPSPGPNCACVATLTDWLNSRCESRGLLK